jgi:hypothetical protein
MMPDPGLATRIVVACNRKEDEFHRDVFSDTDAQGNFDMGNLYGHPFTSVFGTPGRRSWIMRSGSAGPESSTVTTGKKMPTR